jgi:hypothetical protein
MLLVPAGEPVEVVDHSTFLEVAINGARRARAQTGAAPVGSQGVILRNARVNCG